MKLDGFVYAAIDRTGNLKLGFTRKPDRLHCRFGRRHPRLGIIPASYEIEQWFHRQFVADRVPGATEWYLPETPIAKIIMRLPFRPSAEDWLNDEAGFDFSTIGFTPKQQKPENSMPVQEFARLGGLARAGRLNAARRSEIARKGGKARARKAGWKVQDEEHKPLQTKG